MYKSKVIKWGGSQAISLPKALKEDLMLNVGDVLKVTLTEDHKIILEKDERFGGKSNEQDK